ncbi:MAG TPA: DUF1398 family protein [Ohtaekwangia sp.]
MFTLDQIKSAHAKVKSGADFPRYFQDIKLLGVHSYETYVRDGHTIYSGADQYQIQSEPKYDALPVAQNPDPETFRHRLKIHQQGQTDFPTFCKDSAASGVEKWIVEMNSMTCTYLSRSGELIHTEKIPG